MLGKAFAFFTERFSASTLADVFPLYGLIDTFEGSSRGIVESPWPDMKCRADIIELFKNLETRAVIPSEVVPNDWSRFADNVLGMLKSSSSCPRGFHDRPKYVAESLSALEKQLEEIGDSEFPRSISLFQLSPSL